MILRLPNDDDGCMNPHNAPGCYVQQLHAFRLSQHITMLNLIKKNRIIMFVLIILNDNYQYMYMYFVYVFLSNKQMEHSSSVVECLTRNQVSSGSNPSLLAFRRLGIFVLSILSCINEYLAIDSGGNVSDLALARNCCLARMIPGEAELVSE